MAHFIISLRSSSPYLYSCIDLSAEAEARFPDKITLRGSLVSYTSRRHSAGTRVRPGLQSGNPGYQKQGLTCN